MKELHQEIRRRDRENFEANVDPDIKDPEEREQLYTESESLLDRQLVYGNSYEMAKTVGLSKEEVVKILGEECREEVEEQWDWF